MADGGVHAVWSQERIVLALAVVLFAVAAIFLPGFRDIGNLISIIHSVSVLGLLAVGMAIVIIGRGIDLSAVNGVLYGLSLSASTGIAEILTVSATPNAVANAYWTGDQSSSWSTVAAGTFDTNFATSAAGTYDPLATPTAATNVFMTANTGSTPLALLHHFKHMPGDGFTLTVRVGRQNQAVGTLERLGDVVEPAIGLGIDLPDHLEIGIRIDRSVLGREVADMAERRQDLVGGAQIFVDRLGLGRRFHNDDIHVIPMAYAKNMRPVPRDSRPAVSTRTWVVRPALSNRQIAREGCARKNTGTKSCVLPP